MPVFPFFRYPYYNNYYGYNYYNRFNSSYSDSKQEYIDSSTDKKNIVLDTKESENNDSSDSEQVFEIFGIKLFFDDVLIISLLILLYNEGVKDYSLFISLVLLLIS